MPRTVNTIHFKIESVMGPLTFVENRQDKRTDVKEIDDSERQKLFLKKHSIFRFEKILKEWTVAFFSDGKVWPWILFLCQIHLEGALAVAVAPVSNAWWFSHSHNAWFWSLGTHRRIMAVGC